MQKAAFSFINYQFPNVQIDMDNHNSGDMEVDFKTSGVFNSTEFVYELTFDVILSEKEAKDKPFVSIKCNGFYKFEGISSLEEIPNYFYPNSIAILFPYVRAYLSLVTTQANVPGIILPTLNLSHLESELRQNTTQK